MVKERPEGGVKGCQIHGLTEEEHQEDKEIVLKKEIAFEPKLYKIYKTLNKEEEEKKEEEEEVLKPIIE